MSFLVSNHSRATLTYCQWPSLRLPPRKFNSLIINFEPKQCSNAAYSGLAIQHVDLLERYRGLVALGKIQYDEEQIRVIMQLRRLQKELEGYTPPALATHYLDDWSSGARARQAQQAEDEYSWWQASEDPELNNAKSHSLVRVRTHAEEIADLDTPKGLLVTGPPGSGKSFLIDLWFSAVPTPYKARKHYNQIVLELYRAVWEETKRRMASAKHDSADASSPAPVAWNRSVKQRWMDALASGELPKRWFRRPGMFFSAPSGAQPTIAFVVARRLLLRHWLLVFDEVQLLDVSSATLLADVLSWFWRMGGVVVGSSNKVPDDLYKNGVQRDRLEPFVEALKLRCPLVTMGSEHDWRAKKSSSGIDKTWYLVGQEEKFMGKLRSFGSPESVSEPQNVVVFGRSLHIPWSLDGVCKFTFNELCDESLGPADYITITSTFHTVAISDIPVLKLSAKNQARRFISLIDALYEARCRLICLAKALPEELFFPDTSTQGSGTQGSDSPTNTTDVIMAEAFSESQEVYRPNVSSYDAPSMTEPRAPTPTVVALDKLSIFSGKDEQFAFKRALSRLLEMTSDSYAQEETWVPLPPNERKWEIPADGGDGSMHQPVDAPDNLSDERAKHWVNEHDQVRPDAPQIRDTHVWGMSDDWQAFPSQDPRSLPTPLGRRGPGISGP
ncbi:hypothetical protein CERSUDRAFT_136414 [Gelatoporia subvermispora B]|uniref:AAA+ ATPase domain-containing protein n=1 Tax=Ceriporiopsis subvermispora (strain B) TaxID=914234 RepID=M2QKX2_CERS8|nr:hypothetical protein CERSUDRAFT_136414 [Gelatoporia subvermispora B]